LTQRLQVDADAYAHGGVLKFGHREHRAISVASVEAVSGQEVDTHSYIFHLRWLTKYVVIESLSVRDLFDSVFYPWSPPNHVPSSRPR
jgi:hypothetical protein